MDLRCSIQNKNKRVISLVTLQEMSELLNYMDLR